MRIAVFSTAALVAVVGLANAQDARAVMKVPTNIPAQELGAALKSFAQTRDLQVLYFSGLVKNLRTQGAAGELTDSEALSRLLSGTGLTYRYVNDKAVTILAIAAGEERGVDKEGAPPVAPQSPSAPASHAPDESPAPGESLKSSELGEVVITGSRLKTVEAEAALPVNVYTRQDIERSGQPTLTQFLNALNEVSVKSSESITQRAGGLSSVQLRGLPAGSTLVLVNGRRVESAGTGSGTYFPLDVIPYAAVERIEVLPVGSSAVYGGDALAGVVNFVLKSSMDGPAVTLRYGAANGTDDRGVSLATGGKYERGSFMVLGSYNKKGRLSARDRDFLSDADYRRFGGPDARVRTCAPGTVSSGSAANLPGLSASLAGIPTTSDSAGLASSNFIPSAGVPNLCTRATQGNGTALALEGETSAVHTSAEFRFDSRWSAFGELTFTQHSVNTHDVGVELNNVRVPASNPFNPFGTDVRVTGRLATVNDKTTGQSVDVQFVRPLVGLKGQFASGWDLEATVSTARDRSKTTNLNGNVDSSALNAALSSSDPSAALNPFTTGRAAGAAVLDGIWSDNGSTSDGVRDLVGAFLRGPAFQLPAGAVEVIAGAEVGRDRFDQVSVFGQTADLMDRDRRTRTFYGEARIPLLAAESATGRSFQKAALSLAARNDHFSDFDGKTTYQAGIELRPQQSLLLRAAYASSFKPPQLIQLTGASATFSLDGLGVRDPLRAGELVVGATATYGPNPRLQPETGKAHTLGFVWEPELLRGLRVAVSDWKLALSNQITLLSFQSLVDNEVFLPELVTRAAASGNVPGQITSLDWTYGNIGRLEVAGTDMEGAYTFDTSWGKWIISSSATHTRRYELQLTPLTPTEDRLSHLNEAAWAPKWKGRVSSGFVWQGWSGSVTGRYLGEYSDVAPSMRTLGDYWYMDASISADLQRVFPSLPTQPHSAGLTLGVVNLTDRQPEYANTSYFYDTTQADVRGRYFSLQLTLGW